MTYPKDHDHIGEHIRQELQQNLGQETFERWFGAANLQIHGRDINIQVPNRFTADWVDKRYSADLKHAAHNIDGQEYNIKLSIKQDNTTQSPSAPSQINPTNPTPTNATPTPQHTHTPKPRKTTPRHGTGIAHALRHRLEDYVVGPTNKLATSCARAMIEHESAPFPSLFIHGPCGVGKTHLLQGICNHFAKTHATSNWRYVTAEQFTNEYIDAVRFQTLPQLRKKLRRLDLLVVDDIHFFANKTGTQNEFLHTFNEVVDLNGARVIMASDGQPDTLNDFEPALVSRFLSGMTAKIEKPDLDTRKAIINQLAAKRGISLLDSVIEALAARCSGSVRDLEGWLTQLAALKSLHPHTAPTPDEPVGHTLLNQLFNNTSKTPTKPITIQKIINHVCKEMNVTSKEIFSPSRHRRVVLTRGLIITLARNLTNLSYPEIAKKLHRPNHSSIITADQSIKKRMKTSETTHLNEDNTSLTINNLFHRFKSQLNT